MEKEKDLGVSENHARDRLDERHDSDRRGEHRYADEHQTPAERRARQERDELKARLSRQNGA
jgi:hypothetical protein